MPWDHRDRGTIQGTEGPACRGGVGESPNEPREQGGQLKSADVPLERGEMTQEDTRERGEKARRETSVGGTRENRGTQRELQCSRRRWDLQACLLLRETQGHREGTERAREGGRQR